MADPTVGLEKGRGAKGKKRKNSSTFPHRIESVRGRQ